MHETMLVDADETFNHQIVSTFATAIHADSKWTEKVCAGIHDLASEYQLAFGFGKYTNRSIMDGFAGLALGNDQWAVRASRTIEDATGATFTGPIRYEVLEPFKRIRFVLEPSDIADFSFDVIMHGWVPAGLEDRWPGYHGRGGGLVGDVQRYHQSGQAEGWFEHRGKRMELSLEASSAYRDHSWGVRTGVGAPATDVLADLVPVSRYRLWAPMMLRREDGTRYGLFVSMLREEHEGGTVTNLFDCAEELADGRRNRFMMVIPELSFDPITRRLRGGILHVTDQHGQARPLTVTPTRETGFHIGMGGYYAGSDSVHRLGQWHGSTWSDSVSAYGTDSPEILRTLHQTRDVLCSIQDPVAGGSGFATIETIISGPFPNLGLS